MWVHQQNIDERNYGGQTNLKIYFLNIFLFYLRFIWKLSGFVFLWNPLAWVHTKLRRATSETYSGRQLLQIRKIGLTLILIWYSHFNLAIFFHLNQTFIKANQMKIFPPARIFFINLQNLCDNIILGQTGKRMEKKRKYEYPYYPYFYIWQTISSGPIGLVFFLYYRLWVYRRNRKGGNRNDPAPSFNERKHKKYLAIAKKENWSYLGYTSECPIYLSLEERNRHIECVGTTGTGKSAYVLFNLFKQDIEIGVPAIFIDAKGSMENVDAVYQMVKSSGRAADFRLFSLTLLNDSNSYNPLLLGNPVQVCDKIISAMDWSKEQPYFEALCQTGLSKLLTDFEQSKIPFTLQNLLRAMENPPQKFHEFYEFMEDDDNWRYTQSLRNEFRLIAKAPFGFLFDSDNPSIDLRQVYDKNLIVYFSLDMQSYPKQAQRIGKLITADINSLSGIIESTLKKKEKKPLCVYIDEFQAFGTKNFLNALARGRSSGLCVTIAHQSIGDLKAVSPEFAQQVIDLTSTKIFLRVNDPESAQLFSDSLGTYETVEITRQIQTQGTEDPSAKLMGSAKVVDRYRIHPSEIKDLQTGEAVIKSMRGYGKLSLCPYFLGLKKTEEELE